MSAQAERAVYLIQQNKQIACFHFPGTASTWPAFTQPPGTVSMLRATLTGHLRAMPGADGYPRRGSVCEERVHVVREILDWPLPRRLPATDP
eukprot:SM000365S13724  [mRNA]  locus=s365:9256:9840:+ [translate_table: standard]